MRTNYEYHDEDKAAQKKFVWEPEVKKFLEDLLDPEGFAFSVTIDVRAEAERLLKTAP